MSADVRIVPVNASEVENAWRYAEEFLSAAHRKGPGDTPAEKLKERCIARENQLWLATRNGLVVGAAVTGIFSSKGRTICEWLAVGGIDWPQWAHLQTTIEAWAKVQGCTVMRGFFRPGWKRKMRAYRVTGLIMEKVI